MLCRYFDPLKDHFFLFRGMGLGNTALYYGIVFVVLPSTVSWLSRASYSYVFLSEICSTGNIERLVGCVAYGLIRLYGNLLLL